MKCKLTEKKTMTVMLITGLVMIAIGAISGYVLPDEEHLATRIAGFVSGIGSSLAIMAGVVLLRRARLGEERAKDSELTMHDERGMAVAYKAQNVAAIAAVLGLIGLSLLALARGDELYALVCSWLLIAVALIKLIAWHIYNRTM